MSSTSKDYTGRTFSLSILGVDRPIVGQVTPAVYNLSTTGIQKLIEQYAILLLDVLGSNKYQPDQGTRLVPELTSGSVVAKSQLQHILNFANSRVEKILRQSETADTPSDETIASTSLSLASIEGDRVSFSITIETGAGTTVKFTLPSPIGIS